MKGKTEMNDGKCGFVALYKECCDTNFGVLNNEVYNTAEEAIEAIKEDIRQSKTCLEGKTEDFVDEDLSRYALKENGKFVCVWEIQYVKLPS